MNLENLKTHLDSIGAVYGDHYVIDELGEGEVSGIRQDQETRRWYTYYSERGSERHKIFYSSEEEACGALKEIVVKLLESEK